MNPVHPFAATAVMLLGGFAPAFAQDPAGDPGRPLALAHDDASVEWGPCPDFLPEGCALAVLNGDPAGRDADVFFKVPAGASIPLHRHTSAERMTLVAGRLRVRYDGNEPVELTPGMYAYGPAGLAHDGECAQGEDCVLFIAFDGPVDAIEVAAGGDDVAD